MLYTETMPIFPWIWSFVYICIAIGDPIINRERYGSNKPV